MTDSPTRKYVDAFADLMEQKLSENRHKGDREGWARLSDHEIFLLFLGEAGEVVGSLRNLDVAVLNGTPEDIAYRQRCFRRECADAANILMMLADVAGGMQPKAGA